MKKNNIRTPKKQRQKRPKRKHLTPPRKVDCYIPITYRFTDEEIKIINGSYKTEEQR